MGEYCLNSAMKKTKKSCVPSYISSLSLCNRTFWLCCSARLCLHYSAVSFASTDNYVKRWSWRLTEWEIKRFVVVVFPLTDDLLSCLACVRPVYLCWGATVSISNLTQLSWCFAVLRFLCILSARPTIFYLLLLFIFFLFAVVLLTICWFYFIILFVPTQYIFLASTFVLNHR